MDAVIKVQLTDHRRRTAQQYVALIRERLAAEGRFADLDVTFDAGGMIRGAMNEGKSTPINIRIETKDQRQRTASPIASMPACATCPAWSTAEFCSGSTILNMFWTSTAPRRPTWG